MADAPGRFGEVSSRGSLYILFTALLVGTLWSGGYFPAPKWTLLTMLLAAAVWELAVTARRGRLWSLGSPALLLMGAFTLFAAASCLWSVSPDDSLRQSLLLLGYLGVLVVIRGQLDRDGGNAGTVAMWLVYVAAFVSAWGIATYVYRLPPYAFFLDDIYRAGSTFEYSNALSCFVLMALPVTSALMAVSGRRDRPLYAAATAIMVTAAVLTFSRLGMVMLAALAIYMPVSLWRRGLALVETAAIVSGLVTAALAVGLAGAGRETAALVMAVSGAAAAWLAGRYLPRSSGAMQAKAAASLALAGAVLAAVLVKLSDSAVYILTQRVRHGFTPAKLLPHRLDTFDGAVEAFRTHPLAGSGIGTFAEVYRRYSIATYTKFAHNLVLQAAVDTGLAGALLLTLFLVYVLVLAAWRLLARGGPLARAFAVASLVFLAYNMVDWEWYVPSLAAWFMAGVAVMEMNAVDGGENDDVQVDKGEDVGAGRERVGPA